MKSSAESLFPLSANPDGDSVPNVVPAELLPMQGLRRLGEEVIRTKFSKRELRTGRSKLVWNTADAVLTRKSEHLRMVSDWLWYHANAVIDRRCTRMHPQRGPEHPLARKPQRRPETPLHAVCLRHLRRTDAC